MVDFYFASGMYKNQLQELAQRSCFNLPSYTCIREGPDHAPRFKATVNFNGDIFESPAFCTTLRQAEHSAAEVALGTLANRGPSRSLAARVLDETGAYKNLLQETVHRAGLNLPVYTTVRSGPGHVPVFTCNVEIARMSFTGEPAKTKKQAQKNAAMAAWSSLKQMGSHSGSSSTTPSSSPSIESEGNEEQEQVIVSRVLARLCPPETSKSSRNDKHRGRQRSVPVSRNKNLNSGGMPMYPIQYPSWHYSNFPPEAAMHQRWMQDQASHQQTRLLTLPGAGVPPPSPHIIPFIHSIMQPDNMQYFPQESIGLVPGITVSASGPSFCFSNHSMPYQANRSQVTIQEIQDERTQEKEKWVHGKTDPDSRKVNIRSNPSVFSPFEVQNPPMPGVNQAESLIQGMPQDTAFGPRFINPNPVRFFLGSPHGLDSPHGNLRPHLLPIQSSPDMAKCYRPPSIAAPVMIRTVGPASSVRLRPESLMHTRMPAPVTIRNATPSHSIRNKPMYSGGAASMAPAVQIRSVVPVCSAPPTRKIPGSTQDGVLSGGDKKDENTKEAVISSVSELGKLELGE